MYMKEDQTEMNQMRVNLFELEKKGTIRFSFQEFCQYFDIDPNEDGVRFTGPIRGDIDCSRGRGGVVVRGHLRFTVELTCVKCLNAFPFEADVDFFRVYEKDDTGEISEEVELREGDLDVVYYDGDEFIINPDIRDEILVTLPDTPVCSDQCRGLCTVCGKNLNDEPGHCCENTRELSDWKKKLKENFKRSQEDGSS